MNTFPHILKVYLCLFFLLPISAKIFNLPWIVLMLPILFFYFLRFIKDKTILPSILFQTSLHTSLHIFAICTLIPLIIQGTSVSERTFLATGFFLLMVYLPIVWISFLNIKQKKIILNALFITIITLAVFLVLETIFSTYFFEPLITESKNIMPEIYRLGFLRAQGPLGSLGMAGILITFLPLAFQFKSKYIIQIRLILISGIIVTGSYAAYIIMLISLPICLLIKYQIKLKYIIYSLIFVSIILFIIYLASDQTKILSEISESHFNLNEGRLISRAVGHHGAWNYFFNNLFDFTGFMSTSGKTDLFIEIFSPYSLTKRGYRLDAPFLPLIGIETSLIGFLGVVSIYFSSIFSFFKTQKIFTALSVINSFIFGLTTDHRIVFYSMLFVIFLSINNQSFVNNEEKNSLRIK